MTQGRRQRQIQLFLPEAETLGGEHPQAPDQPTAGRTPREASAPEPSSTGRVVVPTPRADTPAADPDRAVRSAVASARRQMLEDAVAVASRRTRDYEAQLVGCKAAINLGLVTEARQFHSRASLLTTSRSPVWARGAWTSLGMQIRRLEKRKAVESRGQRRRPPAPRRPASGPGPTAEAGVLPTEEDPRLDADLVFAPLELAIEVGEPGDPAMQLLDWRLRGQAEEVAQLESYDSLLALSHVRGVDRYDYQLRTVRRILREFHGRALLADEVGLGKTIEAGLCLKEYLLRGLVHRALILVPPALRGQWQDELENKFGIQARVVHGHEARDRPEVWDADGVIVASLGLARLEPHASRVARGAFDIVIVDEAHRLKNRKTRAYDLVDRLKSRFLLLLSATPVENDLIEIHNVLSLLKPGLLSTAAQFRREFLGRGSSREVKDPLRLRSLLREVMIRNTRAVAEAKLPPRFATTLRARPGPEEASLYAEVSTCVRAAMADGRLARAQAGEVLRAAGSSPHAAARALGGRLGQDLADRARAIDRPAKDEVLVDLLGRKREEKLLLFAAHIPTLEHVHEVAERAGRRPALFHGALSAREKEEAIAAFAADRDVLVSSESGGEGFNLQHARVLVNYDLPWNPMRIEQRIGRVHRIGQEREVFIFNLVTRGTIEEEILRVLDEKINMFELVVGEVEAILGRLGEDEAEFQSLVLDIYSSAPDERELRNRFDELAGRLADARGDYERVRQLEEEAFGRDLEA